ncbi:methyltransferase [Yinghuangia soli]|uniref:Hydroxyneurosporene methyltransferase n=1 Tax=Yinghuangia soli TaxID=2908204 RepID=A0AA41U4E7_9ACTN|nr:methyltransferase [Yinghuangia soli]MCF2530732.1 hydroxyneurosporene methyltransferase [Yinghuangia soli]
MPASDDHHAALDRRPGPFDTLTGVLGGLFVGHCLAAVARFGIADALDDTPRTAEELAEATGVNPEALGRVLRLLAAHGVFAADSDRFTHTGASRMLRSDHPQSWRDFAATFGSESTVKRLAYFDYSLQTGLPVTNKLNPDGFFAILDSDPEAGRVFDAAMASKARIQVASVLAAYDFSDCGTIADIGGGQGHLLQAVVDAAERTTGILFDLPPVIERAAEIASDRLTLQPGDFFKDPLPACDTYMLMDVIHDWDVERATAILAAVRKAAPPHARLLLVESVIPDDPGPDWSKAMDIVMLIHTGGRQRTRGEHESLLHTCGFRLKRVIATASDVSIIEAACA